jgi:hypothetical protein
MSSVGLTGVQLDAAQCKQSGSWCNLHEPKMPGFGSLKRTRSRHLLLHPSVSLANATVPPHQDTKKEQAVTRRRVYTRLMSAPDVRTR